MIALETLQLTPEFVASFRALGKKVGYRNLGRAIAYCETPQTSNGQPRVTSIAPNGNGHKPTCAATAEYIRELMGGQIDDLTRKVHNHRVTAAYDTGEGPCGEGCPCGDSKLQYAEVPAYTPKLRAAPRSRPYKGKRYHPICCQLAAEKGTDASYHRHIETHWTQWPSVLRRSSWHGDGWESAQVAHHCKVVAQNLPTRKCCGRRMGLTPDYTDAHHWRYQCDKNPDHCQDVMITIGPS
jgi:hypothetical protein